MPMQVVLAIFVEHPTPFIEEFFTKLEKLDYPRSKLDLFIHCAHEYHSKHMYDFIHRMKNEAESYHTVTLV